MKIAVHIISNYKNGWSVVKSNKTRASKRFEKKSQAILYAKRLKDVVLIRVHNKNGDLDCDMYV